MRSTPETRIKLSSFMRQEFGKQPLKVCKVLFHLWSSIPSCEQATLTNGYKAWVVLPDLVANWAYLRGDFELEVTDFIDQVVAPGMLALDIGAQFGVKSAFLHEAVGKNGRVIAFEPVPATYKVLKKNATNWGMTTYILALSNKPGKQEMWDFGPINVGQNTLKNPHFSKKSLIGKKLIVETTTIDEFVSKNDLITHIWKIDAENSEFDILSGGKQTIASQKPEIIMEAGDLGRAGGEQTKDCLSLLADYGYQFYEIINGSLNLIQNGIPSRKTSNILASQRKF
jgi:FkbM family methyltransferase